MSAKTTTSANEALVREFYEEVMNRKRFNILEETHAREYVQHNLPGNREVSGRDAYEAFLHGFLETFPDLEVTLEDVVAEDELVAVRATYRATHAAELLGVPPTGTEVIFRGMVFFRVEDGVIVEGWPQTDMWDLLLQLGADELPNV